MNEDLVNILTWMGAIGGATTALLLFCYWIYQCCVVASQNRRHKKDTAELERRLTTIAERVEVIVLANDQIGQSCVEAATNATAKATEAATREAVEIVSGQCERGMEMAQKLTDKMEHVVDNLGGVMLEGTEHLCTTVRGTVARAAKEATETAHKTAQEEWQNAFELMSSAARSATDHALVATGKCVKSTADFQQLIIDAQDLTKTAVDNISNVQQTARDAVNLSTQASNLAVKHMDSLSEVLKDTSAVTDNAVTAIRDAQDEMVRGVQRTMNDMNSRGAQQLDQTMRKVIDMKFNATLNELAGVAASVQDISVTATNLSRTRNELERTVNKMVGAQLHAQRAAMAMASPDNSKGRPPRSRTTSAKSKKSKVSQVTVPPPVDEWEDNKQKDSPSLSSATREPHLTFKSLEEVAKGQWQDNPSESDQLTASLGRSTSPTAERKRSLSNGLPPPPPSLRDTYEIEMKEDFAVEPDEETSEEMRRHARHSEEMRAIVGNL